MGHEAEQVRDSHKLTDPLKVYRDREAAASKSADFWQARFDVLANLRMGVILALVTVAIFY